MTARGIVALDERHQAQVEHLVRFHRPAAWGHVVGALVTLALDHGLSAEIDDLLPPRPPDDDPDPLIA
jgi:hypothetical protein